MECTDKELLYEVAAQRDETAFETLSDRLREPLRRHLSALLDPNAAEDVLQETLLRLWTHADQFDDRGSVRGWAFRIAANVAHNARRTVHRRRESALPERFDAPDTGFAPEEALLRVERGRQIQRAVDDLDDDRRELLRMAYQEERSIASIAQALGVPAGTIKSRLYHTRRALARAWEETNDG